MSTHPKSPIAKNKKTKIPAFIDLANYPDKPVRQMGKQNRPCHFPSPAVYIACKPGRFDHNPIQKGIPKHVFRGCATTIFVNTTTCQSINSINRHLFSPLTRFVGNEMEKNVECMWQACKIYGDEHSDFGINDISAHERWWKENWKKGEKAPRRCGIVEKFRKKYKRLPVEVGWKNPKTGEIYKTKSDARKFIYTQLYKNIVIDGHAKEKISELQTALQNGFDIVVEDLDAGKTRNEKGEKIFWTLPVTRNLLEEKIHGIESYGHGYIVAAAIAGVDFYHW